MIDATLTAPRPCFSADTFSTIPETWLNTVSRGGGIAGRRNFDEACHDARRGKYGSVRLIAGIEGAGRAHVARARVDRRD